MKRIWLNALSAWLALFCATLAHSDALLTDVIIVDVEARALTPGQSVLIEGSGERGASSFLNDSSRISEPKIGMIAAGSFRSADIGQFLSYVRSSPSAT